MGQTTKKQAIKKQSNNVSNNKKESIKKTDDLFLTISINDLNKEILTEAFSYRKQVKLEKLAKECNLSLKDYLQKSCVNLTQSNELLRKFELTINFLSKEKITKEIILTSNQYNNYLNLANKKNVSLIDYLLDKIFVVDYKKYNFITLLNDTNLTFLDKIPIPKKVKAGLMEIAKDCGESVEQIILNILNETIENFFEE